MKYTFFRLIAGFGIATVLGMQVSFAQVPAPITTPYLVQLAEIFEEIIIDFDFDENAADYAAEFEDVLNNQAAKPNGGWIVDKTQQISDIIGNTVATANDGSLIVGDTVASDGSGIGGELLLLDVEGALGAEYYCDNDGVNCIPASALYSTQLWGQNGVSGYYTGPGNIGIGTTTPQVALDIVGDVQATNIQATNNILAQGNIGGSQVCNQSGENCVTIADFYNILGAPTSLGQAALVCTDNQMLIYSDANGWECADVGNFSFWIRDGDDIYYNVGGVAIGSDTVSDGSGAGGEALLLDVEGAVGAENYCDANGENCFEASDLEPFGLNCTDQQMLIFNGIINAWECTDQITAAGETLFTSDWIDVSSTNGEHDNTIFNITHDLGEDLKDVSGVCQTVDGDFYRVPTADYYNEAPNLVSGVAFDSSSIYLALEKKIRLYNKGNGGAQDKLCDRIRIMGKHTSDGTAVGTPDTICTFDVSRVYCSIGL